MNSSHNTHSFLPEAKHFLCQSNRLPNIDLKLKQAAQIPFKARYRSTHKKQQVRTSMGKKPLHNVFVNERALFEEAYKTRAKQAKTPSKGPQHLRSKALIQNYY